MDTKGWDIVYVCSNSATNTQLKKYMDENEINLSYSDENSKISLTFSPWEIVQGGSGKLLRIKTPVKKGELIFNNNPINLDGICPLIEIQLGFFNDNSTKKSLAFNFLVKGAKPGDTTDGAVTIINADLNGIITDQIELSLLNLALPSIFIENKTKFSYIFAELNLSPEEKWMKPEKYKYTYISTTSNQYEGFLAILSVVTNRDISKLSDAIDTKILNDNNNLFLLLSERMFLENMILPELPRSFGNGSKPTDFKFNKTSETTGEIVNVNTLNANPVEWGGVNYYPKIKKLRIKIEGSTMVINADGYFEFMGFDQWFYTKSINKFVYNKDTKEAYFIPDSNPWYDYDSTPWWVYILGLVVALIAAISTGVAKSVAKSMSFQANNNFLGNIKTDVISWNKSDNIYVQNVILDVAFGIQGKDKDRPNLIKNGNFATGNLNGWSSNHIGISVINTNGISEKVVYIDRVASINQDVDIKKGTNYKLSCNVRTDINAIAELEVTNILNATLKKNEITHTDTFTTLLLTFNTGDYDVIFVKFRNKSNNSGAVVGTNFILEEI